MEGLFFCSEVTPPDQSNPTKAMKLTDLIQPTNAMRKVETRIAEELSSTKLNKCSNMDMVCCCMRMQQIGVPEPNLII